MRMNTFIIIMVILAAFGLGYFCKHKTIQVNNELLDSTLCIVKEQDESIKELQKDIEIGNFVIESLKDRIERRDGFIEGYENQIKKLEYYLLHPDELDILNKTTAGESGGEPPEVQRAVAETILNKAEGTTIRAVVYAPGAFDVAEHLHNIIPSDETRQAVILAIMSPRRIDSLYFCSKVVSDDDFKSRFSQPIVKVKTIGNMKFWRISK